MARGPLAGPAGPGKFSTRTDGLSFQSPEYGAGVENKAYKEGAQLSTTPDVRATSRSDMGMAPSQLAGKIDLYAATANPNEPITTGVAIGKGEGPEALAMTGVQTEKLSDILAKMLPYDQSGEVEILYQRALARGM